MEPRILVGTDGGLRSFGFAEVAADALAGHTVTAMAHDGSRTWAIRRAAASCWSRPPMVSA